MKKILLLSLTLLTLIDAKAQLFTQNFSSSTTVTDYVSATPNSGQFTSIGNPANNATSIVGGALRFSKTGGSTGYFARNAVFAGPPTLMKISFDFTVSGNTNVALANTQATFFVGTALGDGATDPANANVHSKFAFSFDATNGAFLVRKLVSAANGANSYSGTKTISFIINNSGSTKSYTSPAGTTESIANDTWDLFVGITKEFDDIAATTGTVDLSSFRFSYPSASENANIDIDNMVITELVTLPVSLTSFTGKEANKTILLNWATASEKNNKTFEVLRSLDGKSFSSIGQITGAGNSDTEKTYSFTDENPYAGVNYYQLKQINFDGTAALSEIKAFDSKIAATQLAISPNESGIKVIINSASETKGSLSLFNINGQKISTKNLSLNKGYNDVFFTESLISGTYFINLVIDGKTTSLKFIK